ncbi:MAG: hypothetical protein ABR587_14975 [Candidatus Binatia bacterium]
MSCSVHDVVRLEKLGIPTAAVATEAFLDEALDQARLLAMPDYPMVWLPHPVAIIDEEGIRRLAREAAVRIVQRLTA